MALKRNQSYFKLAVKELDKDDCHYELLQKIATYLTPVADNQSAEPAIVVATDSFQDIVVNDYIIREDGNGKTIGLFKRVEGRWEQITFPLPNEIRLVKGSGIGELVPPLGWKIVDDPNIINRYNIGTTPNYEVAAIVYTGV